jgi:hypothetical protein
MIGCPIHWPTWGIIKHGFDNVNEIPKERIERQGTQFYNLLLRSWDRQHKP